MITPVRVVQDNNTKNTRQHSTVSHPAKDSVKVETLINTADENNEIAKEVDCTQSTNEQLVTTPVADMVEENTKSKMPDATLAGGEITLDTATTKKLSDDPTTTNSVTPPSQPVTTTSNTTVTVTSLVTTQ